MRKNKRVLVIDDDAELCEEIADILCGSGYAAESVSDPLVGLQRISREPFDIVIVDYKMSDLNGIEVLRRIKEQHPSTDVFIASGKPFIDKIIEEAGVACLISGVIPKPFELDTFLACLARPKR